MNEKLGDRIRELRHAKDYTQEQVADQLGISRQRYARIEKGNNRITLDILTKIAEVLDVTVMDITKVLDEPTPVAYRSDGAVKAPQDIFDMLDLFYANRRMYQRLQNRPQEEN